MPTFIRPAVLVVMTFAMPVCMMVTFVAPHVGVAPQATPSRDTAVVLQSVILALGLRGLEGRFTGLPPVLRIEGPTPPRGLERAALAHAIAFTEREARANASATQLRALALTRVAQGDVGSAVVILEDLLSAAGDDASVQNDLAAAYLARALPSDAAAALTASERALVRNPILAEAHYNRALALERLSLLTAAAEAWRRYLTIDRVSFWSREAERRVRQLGVGGRTAHREEAARALSSATASSSKVRSALSDFPQEVRELAERTILPQWAAAIKSADRPAADRALHTALLIGHELAATSGDRLLGDLCQQLAAGAPAKRVRMAEAIERAETARQLLDRYRFQEADEAYRLAALAWGGSTDTFGLVILLQRAVVAYQRNQLNDAGRALETVRGFGISRGYLSLVARVEWLQGILSGSHGNLAQSLGAFERSREVFTRLRETENLASVDVQIAGVYRLMGEHQQAWLWYMEALRRLPSIETPGRRQMLTLLAALACLRQDLPEAALAFLDEFVDAAQRTSSHSAIAEAFLHRARVYVRLAQPHNAATDLRRAAEALERATDREQARFVAAQISLLQADVALPFDPGRAVELLEGADEYFRVSGRHVWLPRVALVRARALRKADRTAEALASLEDGIQFFETQRAHLPREMWRVTFGDEVWDLYAEAVDLLAAKGDTDSAFSFAERGRARELHRRLTPRTAFAPITPATLRSALAPRVAVVVYSSLSHHTLAWVVRREKAVSVRLGASTAELVRISTRARRIIADTDSGSSADEVLAAAYEGLLRPLEPHLAGVDRLIFVPDGAVADLPFAALFDGQARQRLVERVSVSLAPSVRFILHSRTVVTKRSLARSPVALIVGASTLSRSWSTRLPPLPAAAREASRIAELYPDAALLVGDAATTTAVKRMIGTADVFHFAGHALSSDNDAPGRARLILAESVDGAGELTAIDLGAIGLRRGPVVVLAACRTGRGPSFRGEGLVHLARPFLAGGARGVVVTLWDIEDGLSSTFFVALHRHLRDGLSVPDALRATQLEALRRGVPIRMWASTVVWSGT